MGRATTLINRINRVQAKLVVTDRTVFKRFTTSVGGDALTGRGSSAYVTDTKLDPQPSVVVASKAFPLVVSGQAMSPDAEYLVTVTATAMTRAEVTDPTVSILFVDGSNTEELFIIGFSALYIEGTDVVFNLVLATKKR